jgi:ISXO2-like transposase domain
VPRPSRNLQRAGKKHIDSRVQYVMTDDSTTAAIALREVPIDGIRPKHRVINHNSGQYVNGFIHTNTIESAFSLLKRGIIGSFHKVSIKHLQRYLNEFSYRFNRRNDDGAFIETVRRLAGFQPLPFEVLTSEKA